LGTTEIAVTGWQAFLQQIFANTESHTIRTGTANTPLVHQTALKYETAVSDGGRLELKTPKRTRKPVLFAAQESPDDLSDLTEASESAPGLWDNPIDDPGLERFV
jgi:hypothetical protein